MPAAFTQYDLKPKIETLNHNNDISPEELERIERFLSNEMPQDEANAFAQSLNTDAQLREKTEEVRLLLLGINEVALEEQMQDFHKDIISAPVIKSTARVIPLSRKLLVAASVLVVVALSLWLVLQNKQEDLYSKYYTPDPGLATVMSGSSNYDFEKAMVEYKNGEYAKALDAWNGLLKEKPGNDTLIYFIGVASQANKDSNAAFDNLKRIAANVNSAFYKDACWYLGLMYLKIGDKKEAVKYIEMSGHAQSAEIIKAINKE